MTCWGKSSTVSMPTWRRMVALTSGSVPAARPSPRSIRSPWSATSVPNCSATTSEEWFGSITPPDPTRMRSVAAAMAAISTGGDELAMPGMPWCSATQKRRYPSRSASRATVRVSARASECELPSRTEARSRMESGTVTLESTGGGLRDSSEPPLPGMRRSSHLLPCLVASRRPRPTVSTSITTAPTTSPQNAEPMLSSWMPEATTRKVTIATTRCCGSSRAAVTAPISAPNRASPATASMRIGGLAATRAVAAPAPSPSTR